MRAELLVSIPDMDGGSPVGGIYIWKRSEWSAIAQILPAVQSLASQVASVVHQSKVYRETLAHQRTLQELAVAGNIQASFLPESAPDVPGLQIAADLEPARETSGDFFDLIPLWDGRIGVVVADVADKGVGAALYMALSRTLLRTYTTEYSTRYPDNYHFHPERVLDTVNQVIMRDTRSDLFVTLFFGILDPRTGSLTYANAGHNPPLWFSTDGRARKIAVRELRRTGLPVGVMPEQTWQRGSIELRPGDLLVLYTDGITEAMDEQGQLFGSERLVRTVEPVWERPVLEIQRTVRDSVRTFAGDRPQSDDITLLLVRRVADGG